MRHRPTLPARASAKARAAVAKPRPTLPTQASPKAVAAVAKVRRANMGARRKR